MSRLEYTEARLQTATSGERGDVLVSGVLRFLTRTRDWAPDERFYHVRELCVEHITHHVEAANAPHMLKFSRVCKCDELREAATRKILSSFEEVLDASEGFWQLSLREVLDVVGRERLKVGSEEVVCEGILTWLEANFAGTVEEALEELAEMERRIEDGIPALQRLGGVVNNMKRECDRLKAEVKEVGEEMKKESTEIAAVRQTIGELNDEYTSTKHAFEKHAIAMNAAGGAVFVQGVFRGYRGPELKLQKVLEALSVLLGMEQHWSSTRKLANEDALIPVLMRYDVQDVDWRKVGGLFKYAKTDVLNPAKMPSPVAKSLCGWVRAAVSCIELLKKLADERANLERRNNRLEGLKVDEKRVIGELHDMTQRYEEAHANWIGLGEDDVLLRLGVKMSVSRLQREGLRLRHHAERLFAHVNWLMVPEEFVRNRIASHRFLSRFLPGSGSLAQLLESKCGVPSAAFLHDCSSSVSPVIFAARDGRFLRGSSRVVTPKRGAWGREWEGGLTWRPEMSMEELKSRLRVPQDLPKELHGVPWQRSGTVGTTVRGSGVSVSGDFVYVVGGLDVNGRALASTYRAPLDPRLEPLTRKDFTQLAYLHTPRAFLCTAPVVPYDAVAAPKVLHFGADSPANASGVSGGAASSKSRFERGRGGAPFASSLSPTRRVHTAPGKGEGQSGGETSRRRRGSLGETRMVVVGSNLGVTLPTRASDPHGSLGDSPLWMGTVAPRTTDINVWQTIGVFSPTPVQEHQPRECLYVFGGYDEHGEAVLPIEAMELPHCDNWKTLHSLRGERRLCSAAVISDKLFCVGGVDRHTDLVRGVERVDVQLRFDHLGRLIR